MDATILKAVHNELSKGWTYLRSVAKALDAAEERVAASEQVAVEHGRVTPFYVQKTLQFAPFDMDTKQIVFIPDAQRVTKFTSLSYAVTFDETQTVITSSGSGLKPRPKTLFLESAADEVELFDFEWNFSVGSAPYGSARNGRNWLSRKSLGSPDTRRSLIFNERKPLVVRPTDRLEFQARALHYNLDADRAYTGNERFYLHFIATGFRVFGDEERA